MGVYTGLHIVAALAVLWILHARGEPLDKFLHQGWDSGFYLGIARDGYKHSPDYAFFPLFPMLVRGLQAVTGLSFNYAGVLVSVAAGSTAAVGIRYVGERVANARTALILVALWAVVPSAVIQVWAYADGLFTALAAWALYALLRRAWLTAGILTFFAGLTRPTASALIIVVCLAALFTILRRGGRESGEDGENSDASDGCDARESGEARANREARWRPWAGAAIAPLGMLAWILAVGHHFGRLTGYFKMQHDVWSNWFDGGRTTYDNLTSLVDGRGDNPPVVFLLSCATMVAIPFLLVLAYRQRLPWPLLVYSAAVAVLILGSHRQGFVVPREVMPAFPLLLPLAQTLSRSRNRGLIVAMVAIAAMSGWYGWFMPLTYGAP
ncbi:mannosyltransferase family protein [Catenulispora pinisilvae]|uniref:mannosyltransferase family protein n=1 Tax=Catenulispora pinisilvae TaxID=2705253 RepID=UPI001890DDEA|nr:mannosyltransferase family protein [Catenulispora pinisilvae]